MKEFLINLILLFIVVKKPTKEEQIISAFDKLDANNPSHWAYYGMKRQRPDVDAVEEILGWRASIWEVKSAWKNYKS